MEIEFDEYTIDRWQPTPDAEGDTPGRDLAAAGGLTIDTNGNRPDRHPRTANSAGQQTGRGRFTAPWTQ